MLSRFLFDMSPFELAHRLLEDSYSYASTSVQAPPEVADFIMEWGRLNVPDDVIAEDGRENHPHITVKYGLLSKELPEELKEVAKTTKPFPIFMGVISLFTTNPDHDVVKIDVESPALRMLNKRVAEAVPHEDTYPDYHPHLTVAYVQKGTCDHLIGDDPFQDPQVPREFTAYGMLYSAPGDDDDAERTKETLLFSKGERPDPAIEEAVLAPSPEDVAEIEQIVRETAQESNSDPAVFAALANERLAPFHIRFAPHELHKTGPSAVSTPQGVFVPLPTPGNLQHDGYPSYISAVVHHELVHDKQMGRSGNPDEMFNKALAYVAPEGRLNQDRYLQQKQEIMAYAASMVEQWRRQGLTSDQMMRRLRSGNWGFGMKYWHNRREFPQAFNRFVKQATEYVEQLKENVFAQMETPDPFAGLVFPADPDQTRQFLRNSGKRRGERPIL